MEEPDVLKVELKETPVSVSDFFSKVEVIPLETSDSCLLARILRVRVSGDTTYIFTGTLSYSPDRTKVVPLLVKS